MKKQYKIWIKGHGQAFCNIKNDIDDGIFFLQFHFHMDIARYIWGYRSRKPVLPIVLFCEALQKLSYAQMIQKRLSLFKAEQKYFFGT